MDWRAVLHEDRDWNTHAGRVTVTLFRLNQTSAQWRRGLLGALLVALVRVAKFVWIDLLMGAELPKDIECGAGLRLPHGGRGVIVHPTARIGRNVTLYHRTTLGIRDYRTSAAPEEHVCGPVLEDGVYVGVGASILGPVRIGKGAKVGAGAVVVHDVPPGGSVVGIPARLVRDREDEQT